MHAKVFSIQIFQYFHQIPPRVCTLVLFIYICVLTAPLPNQFELFGRPLTTANSFLKSIFVFGERDFITPSIEHDGGV